MINNKQWDNDVLHVITLSFQIYAFFSLFVVIISTVIFIMTTQPELDEFHEVDEKIHEVLKVKLTKHQYTLKKAFRRSQYLNINILDFFQGELNNTTNEGYEKNEMVKGMP